MKPFLYQVASLFYSEYGAEVSRLAFVFPNRRTGLFFQKYLSEVSEKPLFSPTILTINDLFVQLSGKQTADRISMLFKLYDIYLRHSGSSETFDEFLYWGEMLLNDFDDIDKYMADARMLFTNVTDLREIENDFSFLSPEQIAAIRTFWSSFYPKGDTPNQEQFFAVWQILYALYTDLREALAAEGKGYEGMIFREVVEQMEKNECCDLPYAKVVFVGLNALSVAEERFLSELQKRKIADFYWDYASPKVTDPDNKASYFVERNLRRFPSQLVVESGELKVESGFASLFSFSPFNFHLSTFTLKHMATLNIKEYLDRDEQKDLLRFLTAGSVDDGKSTLIGRLLFDSKKLYEDQLDALERDSKRMGNAGDHIDYALLLDGLKAEREQGITIDVAYRYFSTNNRKFIIADTPGHEQYTRNMITGGSTANLAIILVDARTGVITQTRRHTYLVSLLGIKHVVLAVNKMDLVDFDKNIFDKIVSDYKEFVAPLNIPDITCIPLSALDGDNVVEKSDRTPWYEGPSLLDFLETVPIDQDRNFEDFRYPVQYVLRPNLDFRGFCGKVASGIVRKGDTLMALPSGKTSKVKSIVTYDGELDYAFPPQCITITLEDEIDVSRGEMLVHPDNLPVADRNFEAMLVWMDEEPMDAGKQFYIKHTTNLTRARVDSIRYKVNVNTMEQLSVENGKLTAENLPMKLNEIARVVFTTGKELFFDPYRKNKQTGAFILIDPITNNTSAVGMIIDRVDARDMVTEDALAVLNLPELGIGAEHYEAIRTVCKELERQGVPVKCITENK